MTSDVTQRSGAQHGIAERVQGNITVRMGRQSLFVGNPDTAQYDVITFTKSVNIDTLSNTCFHFNSRGSLSSGQQGFGNRQVTGMGDLQIRSGTHYQQWPGPDKFHRRGLIGYFTTLLPGRSATWQVAFGVGDPDDLVMEASPSFEYDPAIITNT